MESNKSSNMRKFSENLNCGDVNMNSNCVVKDATYLMIVRKTLIIVRSSSFGPHRVRVLLLLLIFPGSQKDRYSGTACTIKPLESLINSHNKHPKVHYYQHNVLKYQKD